MTCSVCRRAPYPTNEEEKKESQPSSAATELKEKETHTQQAGQDDRSQKETEVYMRRCVTITRNRVDKQLQPSPYPRTYVFFLMALLFMGRAGQ